MGGKGRDGTSSGAAVQSTQHHLPWRSSFIGGHKDKYDLRHLWGQLLQYTFRRSLGKAYQTEHHSRRWRGTQHHPSRCKWLPSSSQEGSCSVSVVAVTAFGSRFKVRVVARWTLPITRLWCSFLLLLSFVVSSHNSTGGQESLLVEWKVQTICTICQRKIAFFCVGILNDVIIDE